METDVNSPTSTCTSEVSFSVGSSSEESSEEESNKSCIICFCSDEEAESHDCTVCKEGAWKICKKCKERLKRIDKCPVCMTENLDYEEPTPPRPQRQQNVVVRERNPIIIDLILQGLWKDLLLEICVCIFKIVVCILYSAIGIFLVYMIAYLNNSAHCFLQLFLSAIMCIILLIIPITLFYDPRDESGKIYRICIAPLVSVILLTFSGLLNSYCAVVFFGKTEVLIIGGVSLFCCSCCIGKVLMDEEENT
tara:strand:- start:251 stop:1000 length:750 start_codon:yes stop_codon:yes gene_type:complete